MEYLNKNYKSILQWETLQPEFERFNIELDMERTKYNVYSEVYKLHKLGYQHCDLHTSNILVSNPYIKVAGEVKSLYEFYLSFDPSVSEDNVRTQRNIITNFNLDDNLISGQGEIPRIIIIDFGGTQPRNYETSLSIYKNLKCNNDFESIISLMGDADKTQQEDDAISSGIAAIQHIDEAKVAEAIRSDIPEHEKIVNVTDIDEYDEVDSKICSALQKKKNDIGELVDEISRKIENSASAPDLTSQSVEPNNLPKYILDKIDRLTKRKEEAEEAEEVNDEPNTLFNNGADYGGGGVIKNKYRNNFKHIYTRFIVKKNRVNKKNKKQKTKKWPSNKRKTHKIKKNKINTHKMKKYRTNTHKMKKYRTNTHRIKKYKIKNYTDKGN
jgi:hypothetical protein